MLSRKRNSNTLLERRSATFTFRLICHHNFFTSFRNSSIVFPMPISATSLNINWMLKNDYYYYILVEMTSINRIYTVISFTNGYNVLRRNYIYP